MRRSLCINEGRRQSVRTPQPPGATALQAYLRSAISTNFTNERRFFGRTKRVHLKMELNRKKNARKNLWIVPPQSGRDADVASLAALPHLRRFPARGAGARGPGLLASPAALLSGRRPRCLAALSAVAAAAAIFFVSRRIPTRVRNLLAKFCEILVYKVIASHSRKPKIRNMNQKFSKLAKGGPELNSDRGRRRRRRSSSVLLVGCLTLKISSSLPSSVLFSPFFS